VPIPPLTEDRRRDLAKLAGKYAEQQRVAVRNVRREAMEELKRLEKDGEISQDDHKKLETDVQGFTDQSVKKIDEVLKTKEQEIMQV
jgi:ribosome recycling factor